ncbi:MAG: hypothetical protein Q4D74_08985 [Comamonadaceae bacterium]|nr:hypothetical protein [Comamonadaceae bacterium]
MKKFLFLSLLACSPMASAYWMSSDGGMNLSIGAGSYLLSNEVLKSASKSAAKKKDTPSSSTQKESSKSLTTTKFRRSGSTAGLDALIATYPAAMQADARAQYLGLFNAYPQVAQQLGVPVDDVATGLASFLVGAYMAYHNATFEDRHVKAIANQLRQAMTGDAMFARMSDADKQKTYDQLVMLGMMMAVTQSHLQKQPDPRIESDLKEVGKQFLEGMFKVSADRVRLSGAGLQIN